MFYYYIFSIVLYGFRTHILLYPITLVNFTSTCYKKLQVVIAIDREIDLMRVPLYLDNMPHSLAPVFFIATTVVSLEALV